MEKRGKVLTVWFLVLLLVLGLSLVGSEGAPEEYKMGSIPFITGPIPQHGEYQLRGNNLALEDIEKLGLVKPGEVKLIVEDGQASPKVALACLNKLIRIDMVQYVEVIGSSVVLALAPICEQTKVVLINTGAKSAKIRQAGDYIFSLPPDSDAEVKDTAQFCRNTLKATTASILYVNHELGLALRDGFEREFTRRGGTIVGKEMYAYGTTDYRTHLTKINGQNPDIIYSTGDTNESGYILKQAKELGVKAQYVASMGGITVGDTVKIAGEAAEGAICNIIPFDPINGTPEMKKFGERYRTKWGVDPNYNAANSYIAVMLFGYAVKKGARTGTEIKDFLYGVKDWDTIIGKLTIDQDGHAVCPVLRWEVVRGGKLVPYTYK